MQLIIQIKDGEPYQHPILLENFQQAFPDIDINALPSNFAWFERVNPPSLGVYEKNQICKYEKVGNVYKDVWYVDQMTAQEIEAKQQQVKLWWQQTGFASWQFNPVTCSFEAPVPYPQDNLAYTWNESTLNWVLIPDSE